MKYLSDYLNPRLTEIFNMYGCFFAFSATQLSRQAKPLVPYVQLDSGLIIPEYHARAVLRDMDKAIKKSIQEDVEENGILNIIQRELNNHEASYTNDHTDTWEALQDYENITEDMVIGALHGVKAAQAWRKAHVQ